MSELANRLDSLDVRVSVPGGMATAQLMADSQLSINFTPGYYRRASARDLEDKLIALGKLLWVARTKERATIIQAAGGDLLTPERAIGQRDRQFFADLDRLVAQGSSTDGRIRISRRGRWEWDASVRPSTVDELTEAEFTARATQAGTALIQDHFTKVRQLRWDTYHPSQSPRWDR